MRSWRDVAACRGVDLDVFFPPAIDHGTGTWESNGWTAGPAKAICASCPVADICLADAFATGSVFGVRGGFNLSDHKGDLRAARATRLRLCGWCHDVFTATPANTTYCSDPCRDASRAAQHAADRERRKAS
jgi:WhiB family redox-sensing transcriptional regulator